MGAACGRVTMTPRFTASVNVLRREPEVQLTCGDAVSGAVVALYLGPVVPWLVLTRDPEGAGVVGDGRLTDPESASDLGKGQSVLPQSRDLRAGLAWRGLRCHEHMFPHAADGKAWAMLRRPSKIFVPCGVVQWQDVRLWTGKSGFKSLPRSSPRRGAEG